MKRIILAAVLALMAALTGCSTPFSSSGVVGSGNVITDTRDVSGVNGVVLSTIGSLVIIQGDEEALIVSGDDNIVALISTEVRNGILYIEIPEGSGSLTTRNGITYNLTVKDLNSLEVSSAGSITMGDLRTERITVTVSGSGDLTLGGEVQSQDVTLSGAGDYQAADLRSQSAKVDAASAGSATIQVGQALDVTISGAGSVSYYGNPTVTQDISGVGALIALGAQGD